MSFTVDHLHVDVTRTTRTRVVVRVGPEQVRALVRFAAMQAGYVVPTDARVSIKVPTGGDYSGCDLEVDDLSDGGCLTVSWEEVS